MAAGLPVLAFDCAAAGALIEPGQSGAVVACEPTSQILKRLDHRTLVIHGESNLATVPTQLAGLDAALRADGGLGITYRSGEHRVEELLDRVRASGIAIRDLAMETPDLEDVFVALTSPA